MQSILDAINEWIKEILIGAINGNLSTMFGDVNEKVGTMQSFSRPRIKSVVPSAELLLRPPLTASNTARTAGSVLPADRQRNA